MKESRHDLSDVIAELDFSLITVIKNFAVKNALINIENQGAVGRNGMKILLIKSDHVNGQKNIMP